MTAVATTDVALRGRWILVAGGSKGAQLVPADQFTGADLAVDGEESLL